MKNALKILIVDDDKSSSNLLAEVVKRMGFKPIVVAKATDGLNVAKLQTVHAAIIDVLLPKMSGVDLAIEFRKTKFAENPIIFVSGVFKDKTFKDEALKKSDAVDFLFKPFGAEDLQTALSKALAGMLTTEKMSVQSLLVRRLNSTRERAKAIEHLEQVRGQEFPFVLSILMDAQLSGHLNIVNDGGEIFGVTLANGTISEVDSTESQATGVLALINNGFLAQEDWDEFQKQGKKRFPLERLVQEGLVSPHAVAVAKHEQILYDFRTICSAQSMQLNFVPQDDHDETPKYAVTMKELLRLLAGSMEEFFPQAYLAEFYSAVLKSPMQLTKPQEDMHSVWGSRVFAPLTALRTAVETGGTIESALTAHPKMLSQVYQCLHYLVLSRIVIFDDLNHSKQLVNLQERFQQLFDELNGKTPDKVFEYFGGSSDRLTPSFIQKMFDDYERSNLPEHLPSDASPELVELCRRCHEMVVKAKEVMLDDEKRAALYESNKAESQQKLRKSNELTAQGLELLRKGQFQQSIDILKEAEASQPTGLQYVILAWAQVKGGFLTNKAELLALARKLEGLPAEERKLSYWWMAMGVVKRAVGDANAPSYFEKVIEIDNTFMEARRELNSIYPGGSAPRDKKLNDLLTGDITDVFNFFRGKAK